MPSTSWLIWPAKLRLAVVRRLKGATPSFSAAAARNWKPSPPPHPLRGRGPGVTAARRLRRLFGFSSHPPGHAQAVVFVTGHLKDGTVNLTGPPWPAQPDRRLLHGHWRSGRNLPPHGGRHGPGQRPAAVVRKGHLCRRSAPWSPPWPLCRSPASKVQHPASADRGRQRGGTSPRLSWFNWFRAAVKGAYPHCRHLSPVPAHCLFRRGDCWPTARLPKAPSPRKRRQSQCLSFVGRRCLAWNFPALSTAAGSPISWPARSAFSSTPSACLKADRLYRLRAGRRHLEKAAAQSESRPAPGRGARRPATLP